MRKVLLAFVLLCIALVLTGLSYRDTLGLKASEWRCIARDVESGTCDVYERLGRDRGTP